MKIKNKAIVTAIISLCMVIVTSNSVKAQLSEEPMATGLSFGFQLNQYQNDFGMGLQVTSPFFFRDNLAVRARANLMFLEHLENMAITWTPYSSYSLGFVGSGACILNAIHLYGEGGVILITPNKGFSSSRADIGGYGIFGFEFYLFKNMNYFIELGGVGTGAKADKLAFNPIYSNGFSMSTGLRVVL